MSSANTTTGNSNDLQNQDSSASDSKQKEPVVNNEKPDKFGRPSKYKPEYCQMLIDHMAKGLSFESFAGLITITKQTLYNWAEEHQDFFDAKAIGMEKSRVFWESLGIQNVIDGYQSAKLNNTVWVFNMKNRFGWRDQINIEQTVEQKESKVESELKEKLRKLLDSSND